MSDFDCDPLFSRLYLEMLEQMTAYSARRLGDIGLAEDVAQDTFAECLEELGAGTAGEVPPKSQRLALGGPEDQTQEDAGGHGEGPHGAAGRAGPPACGTCGAEAVSERLPSTRHIPGGPADRPPPAGGLPLSVDRGKDGHDGDPVPGAPVSSEGEAEKI